MVCNFGRRNEFGGGQRDFPVTWMASTGNGPLSLADVREVFGSITAMGGHPWPNSP
jgi:hypothetical protein